MTKLKRPYADVVSDVVSRIENLSREEWQQRLDRASSRFDAADRADFSVTESGLSNLVDTLGPRLSAQLSRLSSSEVDSIRSVAHDYLAHLKDTEFAPWLCLVFEAKIKKNLTVLGHGLLFLVQLEPMLRTLLIETAIQTIGKNWLNALNQASDGIPRHSKLDTYSITDYLTMLAKVEAYSGVAADQVGRVLGVNWRVRFEAVVPYRNNLVHGRIAYMPELVEDGWPQIARTVFAVGMSYNSLIQFSNVRTDQYG